MINIRYQLYEHRSTHEIVSLIFTYGILFLLVAFPFFILIFFTVKTEKELKDDKPLIAKYGALFEGLQLRNKRGVLFNFVFTVRRFFFAALIVYGGVYPWL